jgi:predicted metal-binding membrane protein
MRPRSIFAERPVWTIMLTAGLIAVWIAVGMLGTLTPAAAQGASAAQTKALRQACRADFQTYCADVPTGGSAALSCLQRRLADLTPSCQQAVRAVGAGAAGAGAAAGRTDTWPHTIRGDGGTVLVHQPQVAAWPDRQTLNTRIALSITPDGAKTAVLGSLEASFATTTDMAARQVTLTNARLTSSRFPAADTAQAARLDERIRAALASLPPKQVPLDMVLMSLRTGGEAPASVPLQHVPPTIFVSQGPASLLVFDGEPVLAPVSGTSLSVAVNTNWDVFVDADSETWYWLNNGAWLRASVVEGPWTPAGPLPAAFSSLPDDRNFAEVRRYLSGRSASAADMPQVFVSTTPAEIIVMRGAPQYSAIPGTQLQYVSNTDAPLFRHSGDGLSYFLVSGRWFSAPGLQGPWTFATPALPPDFARIPPGGPRGFVLVSVPGTVQAQEALIQAQIPRQATLDKASTKLDVVYAGEPKFEPIEGTSMAFAVNTSFNVVKVDNQYWACHQGAWFTASAPVGAWTLAVTVPAVIYTIPPASPLYPCTYVRVYASTPTRVTVGYTAGYTMGFISAGVVVYGTGWYYPPYVYRAPIPVYYPYPVTYGAASWYNPSTGAWARGGGVYGPTYGASRGAAYNPATGAWGRGGSVYGPYGGAGAFSAYNPSTGSYARGGAAYRPDGAAGNAGWYNARTGVSGSTQQNADAYGRWGSSTLSGPNQTVSTQSRSDSRGTAGSFSASSGATGAGVRGTGGNSAGALRTSSGDIYAGSDGNVYRKNDSGWQQYDNGTWNAVQKPQRSSGARGGSDRAQRQGSGQLGQLEQDRQARLGGSQRQRKSDR